MSPFFLLALIATTAFSHPFSQGGNPDPSNLQVQQNGRRIVLNPHGLENVNVGQDSQDTRNLLWSVDNLRPGGTIFIRPGQFHITRTLVFSGFRGKILGAGMNKTTIVFRGPMVDGFHTFPPLTPTQAQAHLLPAWPYGFIFRNREQNEDGSNWPQVSTDLTIEQLSLTVVGRGPRQEYFGVPTYTLAGAILVTDSKGNYDRSIHQRVEHFDVTFRNVYVYGQPVPSSEGEKDTNLERGIFIYGAETWIPHTLANQPFNRSANGWIEVDHLPVNTRVEVSNCRFFNTLLQGVGVESPTAFSASPSLTFPSTPYPSPSVRISDNTFLRVAYGVVQEPNAFFSAFILSPSSTYIVFSGNTFLEQSGIALAILGGQEDIITAYPQSSNTIFVEYNTFMMTPPRLGSINRASVFVGDFNAVEDPIPLKASLLVTVQYNTFIGSQGFYGSMIQHYIGLGLVVVGNTFQGFASEGVSVGASQAFDPVTGQPLGYLPVFGSFVAYNDFSQFTHAPGAYDVNNVPLCLQCTVIQPGDDVASNGNVVSA